MKEEETKRFMKYSTELRLKVRPLEPIESLVEEFPGCEVNLILT